MVVTLANVLLRQAEKTGNARQYLDELITSKWTTINKQEGQIIGTSVNGKTVQLQTIPGMGLGEMMTAAELALSALERGLTRVPRQTYAITR
jgi:hypothetical protein